MGSTGSGRFTDYTGTGGQSGGEGAPGGRSGSDRCNTAFSCSLEDVEHHDYYTTHNAVPPAKTALTIRMLNRPTAYDAQGLAVGVLPTSRNYLAGCIREGHSYTCVVSGSSLLPVAKIIVDVAPN